MHQQRFPVMPRSFTVLPSRRDVLRGLAATGVGLALARHQGVAEARKKHKHKKKGKKPKPNAFGCVNVGGYCTNSGQCCSGLCEGKKGKRKCIAHDVGICKVDSDVCTTGRISACDASLNCECRLTTGNAPFCGTSGSCRACATDTDCQAEFGPGAACIALGGICTKVCPDTGGTACMMACTNDPESANF